MIAIDTNVLIYVPGLRVINPFAIDDLDRPEETTG
jgi:hypothetical protein